ncbi:MAG: hypothetical protein ACKOCZ_10965 [Betaproteobacteria bacterium]|nr:hypothetical protein [Betaproteobacteria bacterium]
MAKHSRARSALKAARPPAPGRSTSGVLRIVGAGLMGGLGGLLIDLLSIRAHRSDSVSEKSVR